MLWILIILALLFFPRGKGTLHPHHPPPLHEIIVRKLNLDREQQKQFQALRDADHHQLKKIGKQKSQELDSYFSSLKDNEQTGSNIDRILQLEQERIDATYEHFEAVKELCREEQHEHFPEVVDIAIRTILGPGPRGPHRKRVEPK